MKKGIILATFVLVMGTLCMACGGGGDGDDDDNGILGCPDIEGAYTVDKIIDTVVCDELTIDPGDIQIPLTSTLEITQALCTLVAVEDGTIPYIGKSHKDDSFDLDLDPPDDFAFPLQVDIPLVGLTTCEFNGSIHWDGDVLDNHVLSGEIVYQLDKHPDETQGVCPNSVTIDMDFEAVKQ